MKFARLKKFATSAALAVSIVLSFGMGVPVAAMATTPIEGMTHESTSVTNCISQHHTAPGAVQKVTADEPEHKDDEPNPTQPPYFVQFQKEYPGEQQVTPEDIARSSSYRPPDILKLTSNLRF